MKIPTGNWDLRLLRHSPRTLFDGPIRNLKEQVDDLWSSAADLMPADPASDLIEHVERTLQDLRGWRSIGLTGQFAT